MLAALPSESRAILERSGAGSHGGGGRLRFARRPVASRATMHERSVTRRLARLACGRNPVRGRGQPPASSPSCARMQYQSPKMDDSFDRMTTRPCAKRTPTCTEGARRSRPGRTGFSRIHAVRSDDASCCFAPITDSIWEIVKIRIDYALDSVLGHTHRLVSPKAATVTEESWRHWPAARRLAGDRASSRPDLLQCGKRDGPIILGAYGRVTTVQSHLAASSWLLRTRRAEATSCASLRR